MWPSGRKCQPFSHCLPEKWFSARHGHEAGTGTSSSHWAATWADSLTSLGLGLLVCESEGFDLSSDSQRSRARPVTEPLSAVVTTVCFFSF